MPALDTHRGDGVCRSSLPLSRERGETRASGGVRATMRPRGTGAAGRTARDQALTPALSRTREREQASSGPYAITLGRGPSKPA